jgi:hypothetical protein
MTGNRRRCWVLKYLGKSSTEKHVIITYDGKKYYYMAEYESGSADSLETAQKLAQIASFSPSVRIRSKKEQLLEGWTWKQVE